MIISDKWKDYKILNVGNGEKIELWKNIILRRPEPNIIWNDPFSSSFKVDAIYHRSNKGGGYWEYLKPLPKDWTINYKNLKFKINPTGFKHTGLFPEQAANWDFIINLINKNNDKEIKILNLFAYTGGATIASSIGGATEVVHVDASKGMNEWAKENVKLNNLEDKKIRFIVDDCISFVEKEKRRGRKYHGIIMDPPAYGRGPNGSMWKLENNLYELISKSLDILDNKPLFFIVNAYTSGFTPESLKNIMKKTFAEKYKNGTLEVDEIGLPIENSDLILPCGITGRWFIK